MKQRMIQETRGDENAVDWDGKRGGKGRQRFLKNLGNALQTNSCGRGKQIR